jgi:hypothetical protein
LRESLKQQGTTTNTNQAPLNTSTISQEKGVAEQIFETSSTQNTIHNEVVSQDIVNNNREDVSLTVERQNINSDMDHVPVIRTMGSDIIGAGLQSKQLDNLAFTNSNNNLYQAPERKSNTLLFFLLFIMIAAIGAMSAYLYFKYINNKALPLNSDTDVNMNIVKDTVKDTLSSDSTVYEKNIKSLNFFWPEASSDLVNASLYATGTDQNLIVNLSSFEAFSQSISSNEFQVRLFVMKYFNYTNVNEFNNFDIVNIQDGMATVTVRVADGSEGMAVYGYVKDKYFIITKSLKDFKDLYLQMYPKDVLLNTNATNLINKNNELNNTDSTTTSDKATNTILKN